MDPDVYARMAAHDDKHWWFVARRRILARAIARQVRPSADLRILEAGCGTGGNLPMLRKFGHVSAFEMDADARRLAKERSGVEVLDGRLPDRVPFAPGSFDLVALLDVLEHVEDDVGSLAAAARTLAPGGRLLLTVPAYQFLWSRHDELHHHKRRYDRQSLLRTLQAAGLEPLHVSYFNTLLFPVVAGVRQFGKLFGIRDAADDALPPAVLNRLLTTVFGLERYLVDRWPLPFGVSLLLVARQR